MGNIEELLRRWGAWARETNGLRVKPLMMFDDGTRAPSRPMMSDDEAAMFDPAVAVLSQIDKELFDVIRLHYVYGMSFRAIALMKRVHHSKVNNARDQGAAFIYGYFCALCAEKS